MSLRHVQTHPTVEKREFYAVIPKNGAAIYLPSAAAAPYDGVTPLSIVTFTPAVPLSSPFDASVIYLR